MMFRGSEPSSVFLGEYLKPIRSFLADPNVSEISCNGPGGVFVERRGVSGMSFHAVDAFTSENISVLAEQVAALSNQMINREHPLLSASLSGGERIQVVLPPCCEFGAFSIRKKSANSFSLDDFNDSGAFSSIALGDVDGRDNVMQDLKLLFDKRRIKEMLQLAVLKQKNIIISGGTSSGKTTFFNAVASVIPAGDRLVTIEDTRELDLIQENQLNLLASKGGQGQANVSVNDLLEASLRLRPDRILVGELRGSEAYTFLRAIQTGHPGSITTLHADTPRAAFNQLVLMITQAGLGLDRETIMGFLLSIVDVVIQMRRDGSERRVSEVYLKDE